VISPYFIFHFLVSHTYISSFFFSLILDRCLFATEGKKNQFIPENLHKILVSEDILKVGVNISGMLQYVPQTLALKLIELGDARRIYKYLNISMQGAFELSDYRNLLNTVLKGGGYIPKRLISLASLTEEALLLPLSKGKVRLSQWKSPLTTQQIKCTWD
jgi:hypothetical protein